MVDRCTEIIFRLFQEDIADDDWLAEGKSYSSFIKKKKNLRLLYPVELLIFIQQKIMVSGKSENKTKQAI